MDELSVAGPSTVVEVDDGVVSAPYLLRQRNAALPGMDNPA
jgi:hypothetical protein